MPPHGGQNVPQTGPDPFRATGDRGGQVGEQPRPAQTAAPDHDAVASRLIDHVDSVVG
jgi:hypothetical protein